VFDNIKKFVLYLLSCNFAEILVMLLSIAIGCPPPFTSIMILLANIVADIPPSMSLGIEPPEIDIMERQPRDPKHGVITPLSGTVIAIQSTLMGLISLAVYLWTLAVDGYLGAGITKTGEDRHAQTLTYMLLTTMQLFQGFLSRSIEHSVFKTGFLANRYMFGSFFGCFAVMVFVIFVPPVAEFFTCEPLTDYRDWLKIFGAVIVQLILVELMKGFLRRRLLRKQRNNNRSDTTTSAADG
jgi:Ca2+-transporting ATPase